MERAEVDLDELVEFWTLLDEDRELLVGKRGGIALAFAVLLKHYSRHGSFPRGRADVPGNVVEFLARQVGVEAGLLDAYEWSGSTFDYHRAQIRSHLGFRTATVGDQVKLTEWLARSVAGSERRPDRVREELLAPFRADRLEPRPRVGCSAWSARRCARPSGTGRSASPGAWTTMRQGGCST